MKKELMTRYSKDLTNGVISYTLEKLNDLNYEGFSCYGCDLHNEIFNTDYVTIGTYQARQEIGENIQDFFEMLEHYKENFGTLEGVNFNDSERLLNLLYYMIGQEILNELGTINKYYDIVMEQEGLQELIKELKKYE